MLINNLENNIFTFNNAEKCLVFLKKSESVLFYDYFKYMQDYYELYYSEVFEDYEEYKEHIFSKKDSIYTLKNEYSNSGEELNAYYTLEDEKRGIYAMIKIKVNTYNLVDQMENILLNLGKKIENSGMVAITNKDSQVLLHVGDDELLSRLSNDDYSEFDFNETRYVSISIDDSNSLRYTYILPKTFFASELKQLTRIFLLVFLFFVLTIILIGAFLMQRHAKSLQSILYLIDTSDKKASIFNKIDYKIQALIGDNALLSSNLKQEQKQLTQMFYEKLLNGSYLNEKELEVNMQTIGLNINGNHFCACNLCTDIFDQNFEIDAVATKNISIKLAASDISIHNLFSNVFICNQIVTVIFFSKKNIDEFENNINLFIKKFQSNMQQYNFNYYICLGEIVNEMMQIRKSYNQAQLLRLKYAKRKNVNNVYRISKKDIDSQKYDELNDSMKNQIYMLVYKGEVETINSLLNDIIYKTIDSAESKATVTMYIYTIWELFIKILNTTTIQSKQKYQAIYSNLDRYTELNKINYVLDGFKEIAEFYKEANSNKEEKLIKEIIEFVHMEFTNPDISLNYLADSFGMSVTKLSKLFKDNGIEYLSYITDLRMEKAKQSLTDTNDKIKSIAKQTGYTSLNSFCRAFKRLQGISPNEYRINNKNS